MDLRQSERTTGYSPDRAIFLPDRRESSALREALDAEAKARRTAKSMEDLAQQHTDLAQRWHEKADEHRSVADQIIARTLGGEALDALTVE